MSVSSRVSQDAFGGELVDLAVARHGDEPVAETYFGVGSALADP
jgi:hypothetical protein